MLRARRIVKWLLTLVSLALIVAGLANLRYLGFGFFAPNGLNIQCTAGGICVIYGANQPPTTAKRGFGFWCSDPFSKPFDFVRHWRVNATWPRVFGITWKSLIIPLWIPLALALCGLAFIRWTEREVAPHGHCVKCGYNLTANVSGQCPECGTPCGAASRQPAPQGDS